MSWSQTVAGWWQQLATRTAAPSAPPVAVPRRPPSAAVSLDRALSVSSVYRCVSILATATSQLTLTEHKDDAPVPASSFVRRPDPNMSVGRLVKRTVIGLAGTGNAYWRIYRDAVGAVLGVSVLDPLAVAIRRTPEGRKVFDYADAGRTFTFNASDVQHLRLLEVPGHDYGLGPIQAARVNIAGALDLRDYAGNWFSEAAIPTGVLTSQAVLTKEQADAYRARWHETQATRDIAILGQGLTYEPILLNPADAQFLENQQFSVTDIARLFGVPAAYLLAQVSGSSMTYQSLEMADTQFLRYTGMQYLSEIEDAVSELLPRGRTARFNVAQWLRPDAQARATINATYHAIGARTINEIRREEGWPALPGADQPTSERVQP